MPQLSLYLNDATMSRLRDDAQSEKTSLSKYVSSLIENKPKSSSWPDAYWETVYGSLNDDSFIVPEEINASLDGSLVQFD